MVNCAHLFSEIELIWHQPYWLLIEDCCIIYTWFYFPIRKKLEMYKQKLMPRHPPVFSEWFLKSFPDPTSWWVLVHDILTLSSQCSYTCEHIHVQLYLDISVGIYMYADKHVVIMATIKKMALSWVRLKINFW